MSIDAVSRRCSESSIRALSANQTVPHIRGQMNRGHGSGRGCDGKHASTGDGARPEGGRARARVVETRIASHRGVIIAHGHARPCRQLLG